MRRPPDDILGAHVSTTGGVANAPARGAAIRATAIQVFTKTPNQWREPALTSAEVATFRAEVARRGMRAVVSHDSYLINLASPDEVLRKKSAAAFKGELVRCRALGIPWVVSHPGNFIDDRSAGLERNAREYAACLTAVPGEVGVLIEGTGQARRWDPHSKSCGRCATPSLWRCGSASPSASIPPICTPRGMMWPATWGACGTSSTAR
ncbi:MAG: hypothetical protein DMD49_02270 [Gemmatimonadetes bacterium]|nr:MAG: hypothetical protein DMD49_02270 [Gemmatimonadota bacterium]